MSQDTSLRAAEDGMDNEHRVQVGLIVALEQGLALGKSHGELLAILGQLVDYTNVHFMSEQLLMRLHAYPEISAHEAAHDKLVEQSRRIMADFSSGELSTVSAELLLLKQWLLDHIRADDYAFHLHLREQPS
ncbi:MAG: bacteriohemerythrin [Magnetospirillum sp.]|nr:MAG: bacteriohemerythrin [Magnetospirillum sp.]